MRKWIDKQEDCKTLGDVEDYMNTGLRAKLIKQLTYPFNEE